MDGLLLPEVYDSISQIMVSSEGCFRMTTKLLRLSSGKQHVDQGGRTSVTRRRDAAAAPFSAVGRNEYLNVAVHVLKVVYLSFDECADDFLELIRTLSCRLGLLDHVLEFVYLLVAESSPQILFVHTSLLSVPGNLMPSLASYPRRN